MSTESVIAKKLSIEEFSDTILPWYRYQKAAHVRHYSIPDTITDDNRLICQTQNFFVILGLGAFVLGYLLVIPKDEEYLSFAALPKKYFSELRWLIKNLSVIVSSNYNKIINNYYKTHKIVYVESAIFEHGMVLGKPGCACNKQAHLHLMIKPHVEQVIKVINWFNQISEISSGNLKSVHLNQEYIISQVISERIESYLSILYEDFQIQLNLQAIREYQESFKLNVSLDSYPQCASSFIEQNQPYVFFWTQNPSLSFICSANLTGEYQPRKLSDYLNKLSLQNIDEILLGSQLGRQIVATFWGIEEPIWNWRCSIGGTNMFRTMLDLAESLVRLEKQPQARLFAYQPCMKF